jgi:hypothetical protein
MSVGESSWDLEYLLQVCDSITDTAITCRTLSKAHGFTSATLAKQIARERDISKWLDRQILQHDRLQMNSQLVSAIITASQSDQHQSLIDACAQLQLEHTYLSRILMAKILNSNYLPTCFEEDSDGRLLRLKILRLRNDLVERTLDPSRQLTVTRQRIRLAERELHQLRCDCQDIWSEMEENEICACTTKARDESREALTAEQHIQRLENHVLEHVITDLLAACDIRTNNDERLNQMVAIRIDRD